MNFNCYKQTNKYLKYKSMNAMNAANKKNTFHSKIIAMFAMELDIWIKIIKQLNLWKEF
jgi:hypothetical protein